ncbi:hypothetical protein BO70DRAFT_379357 [Aspergillus heteromorphus CBS 117.55]|uniref:Heterokaryon incompatibility domain-containing protein n=1 Tax=Aspergillus heteromorphus CBS 117.55 TaxID=1448321 RepID=A0A317WB76_9EURO|nr:uncharacterized protein BO70DRAFT_379357 [Aspergillus heteromorphus CBS 117.55]PWY83593.1 hypothetical protein BO70DRAFT_379357 [Aspergillus heteromorphus CBS 117.55]
MSSNLCEKCKFLHFTAESLSPYGFTEKRADNDELHLQFPAGQQSVTVPYGCRDDLPDLPRLRESAEGETGCGFCALLRDSLLRGIADEGVHRWALKRNAGKRLTVKVAKMSIMAAYRPSDDDRSTFAAVCVEWDVLEPGRDRSVNDFTGPDGRVYFKLCAHSDDPLARYLGIAYPHPEQHILSAANAKVVRDQLLDCDKEHIHVSSPVRPGESESDRLPSRLIEITQNQDGRKLRLVETKDLGDPGNAYGSNCREGTGSIKYVALSYRWGYEDFLTTTPSNLKEHFHNIPLSPSSPDDTTPALPQGFKDVVDICCELGIFHLWIDSLCIIQKETKTVDKTLLKIQQEESRRDWATESAKMHSIYMSSYLTIFLVTTDTPLQGVLERPAPSPDSIVAISYSVEHHPDIRGSFFIQPLSYTGELDHLVWHPFLAAEDALDSSLWNTRGWTLQERLLSPRKLYIGVTDMLGLGLFSCPQRSEYGRDIEDIKRPRRHKSLDNLAVGSAVAGTDVSGQEYSNENLYQAWYRIVEDYTCRDLTVSTDKLPALSGIARTQALALNDQYVVGLWARDLAMGLLWAPRYAMNPGSDRYFGQRERKPLVRPDKYRAPSWSWCAHDGQIEFVGNYLHRPRSEIEVLGHELIPEYDDNPYGQLAVDQGAGGYVKLRAKVIVALLEARHEPRPDTRFQRLPEKLQPQPQETGFQLRRVQVAKATGEAQSATIFLDHSGSYPDAEEVYLMIVSRGDQPVYSTPGQYESGVRSAGLVLRKCPGQTRLQFERIGIYSHFWDAGITSLFNDCEPQAVYLV